MEFNGHTFKRTGQHWLAPRELTTRIAPGSKWLVLQSWSGEVDAQTRKGTVTIFLDIYGAGTGRKVLTIEGAYFGKNYPGVYLGRTGWLNERYLIVPLGWREERCLVCDFHAGSASKETKQ